jgi:hypothetical protein
MSQENRVSELKEQTRKMLQGRLNRVRAAGLAAALVPLATVAVVRAENVPCPSGGVCGFVWTDTNGNGVQDAGEPGIPDAVVTITFPDGTTQTFGTNPDGTFNVFPTEPGTFTVSVQVPNNTQPSPTDQGTDDTVDSDGTPDDSGNSKVVVTVPEGSLVDAKVDFGFKPTAQQPGTGTPGYWVNHPEAWPVSTITVGGKVYTKEEALVLLASAVKKDKTLTMFASLVAAKLNVLIGNDGSCVAGTIALADAWMATYPAGSGVAASSVAWKQGEPLHRTLDNYDNGMLCAPHRE